MAKLYFYYSSMNAGKSALLLLCNHNYISTNMNTLLLTPEVNNRHKNSKISSRVGLESTAVVFGYNDNLYEEAVLKNNNNKINCIFVDEAQFMSKEQVEQLSDVCDNMNIPVLAYGLRTDSNGNLFEGSARLLALSDKLIEVKTICNAQACGYFCDKKATMVVRLDEHGYVVRDGEQIMIGDQQYISVCRKHYKAIYNTPNKSK